MMAKPISCVITGFQKGYSRVSTSFNAMVEHHPRDKPTCPTSQEMIDTERPKLKTWRCELTALSHVYNLYFVAYSDLIYVYQPTFPTQSLPEKPALILRPPISSPDLDYVLDPQCPHSINRIHLDFLGRDEIVLVVCDDGDVVGYSVTKIQRAIERRKASATRDDDDIEEDVKTFIHRNVGISAWGLAVHQQARMIAISANSHEVTVIAYALANFSDTDSNSSESSSESLHSSRESSTIDFPHPRRKDHIFTLRAATNIPSISFDNNGTDPTGRWLFSSSIDGKTILWDLHNPDLLPRVLRMGRCVNVGDPCACPATGCDCRDQDTLPHAAWHAMFVDPRSCQKSRSFQNAFGVEPTERLPCYWDITSSKQHGFPSYPDDDSPDDDDSSDEYDPLSPGDDSGGSPAPTSMFQEEQATGTAESEDEEMEDEQSEHGSEESQVADELGAESLFVPETTITNEDSSQTSNTIEVIDASGGAATTSLGLQSATPNLVDLLLPAEAAIYFNVESGTIHTLPRPQTKKPYFELTTVPDNPTRPPPPAPSLPPAVIVTKQDVYLVQPRHFSSPPLNPPSHASPVIMLCYPQFSIGTESNAPRHDRLCYTTQVPELGIVLVGTPAGKVVVLSLTQIVTEQKETGKQETVYGMRLDHVVPGPELGDESEYLHDAKLMGFAVGPVQGMLDTPADDVDGEDEKGRVDGERKPRRWRLMLMFHDHSVVSYELGKQRDKDDTSVADLIV